MTGPPRPKMRSHQLSPSSLSSPGGPVILTGGCPDAVGAGTMDVHDGGAVNVTEVALAGGTMLYATISKSIINNAPFYEGAENVLQLGVIAPGMETSEGICELTGVPPGASVMVTSTTVMVVVTVGTTTMTVVPDFTKVSEEAVDGGYGLGSNEAWISVGAPRREEESLTPCNLTVCWYRWCCRDLKANMKWKGKSCTTCKVYLR